MNMIDMLLSADIEQIERPTKVVEIKRLSNIFGEPFTLLCKALTYDKYTEIQDKCLSIKGKDTEFDVQTMQIEMVLNGVFNVADGTRFFSNKELQTKFKVHTHKELIKKILLSGEISHISDVITDLTGYGDNNVEVIKGL